MYQPQRLISLTLDQLTEVCVHFGVFMAWTPGPDSPHWGYEVRRYGGAESFH